jgi:hypothetical protein
MEGGGRGEKMEGGGKEKKKNDIDCHMWRFGYKNFGVSVAALN